MKILRTPDERFENLPGYPFAPNYIDVPNPDAAASGGDALRVHYLDEGPKDAAPVLLMHGEPSWSYLYRTMIPVITAAGHRVIAPDLVGFGRSDKPTETGDYTYQRHVDWMRAVLEGLNLTDVTLVCQDWGGLIGLRLLAEHPERFARAVAGNTFLPIGDRDPGPAFKAWQKFSQETPVFKAGNIVKGGCAKPMAEDVVAAYDAPFPDESYKAGARIFPQLVPTSEDDPASEPNRAAWVSLSKFKKPFLTAFSDKDPITGGGHRGLQENIPGAAGQPHTTIEGGGHFLQEDCGPALAKAVVDFIAAT